VNISDYNVNVPTKGPLKGVQYIVDATEIEIARPTNPEQENECWSGKAHVPALKYEGSYIYPLIYIQITRY